MECETFNVVICLFDVRLFIYGMRETFKLVICLFDVRLLLPIRAV